MNLKVFCKDNFKIFCIFRFFDNIAFFKTSPNLLWISYYIYYYRLYKNM